MRRRPVRSIICISLLAAAPAAADGLGCFAVTGLEDQPVEALSLYIYHNASRQGRYATLRAETTGGQVEHIVPCPTDRACIAPNGGGSLAIERQDGAIEVITDRFLLGEIDLGNGTPAPERYQLSPSDQSACGSPRAQNFGKILVKNLSKIFVPRRSGGFA